ncbi:hypothetical protein A3A76_01880 [Candidatus Woesebacteria bacterium RIFCSPLOWO2_01_FULL_39_23]|uniref:Uncharacterized protein n=1 Tax=Candidatus Woesebacteria bacterium RIFCSPHIGHO2_01_FULL_40_22 TaxID=1802499 RepID=A0A1F7YG76_9BACT|nr:MAG: hypothetical protein A2141_05270 [Candidatus Woesebacteria bacterium RBG_16_40_11]OGM26346.1 MAG: hypothetical protein A2628_03225 [Candidatus Woesebacteria bacterium RIFCSPHIGHO2_01_FULL_40_22]OGM37596.1 MAG: hypothetical protein A3E41_05200 [Candidatus Woesebacteria bacterium RIFCSPHIGHO2_12_FULL_38_9]OGM61889.1 MAG: hypothetical protein A3A76_01880 [Candidatus Woesebacteria bacterium RIFCSPLOWO2_01_FULL_39_23]
MKEIIRESVKNSNTLAEVRDSLFSVFKEMRAQGHTQIGYVSGTITADGKENIPKNIARLDRFTEHLRVKQEFPIFSATDVFDNELFRRLDAAGFVNADWEAFWREVLGAEEMFVTDMFMTPRWEKSSGSTDEHRVAQEVGMAIVYIEKELE